MMKCKGYKKRIQEEIFEKAAIDFSNLSKDIVNHLDECMDCKQYLENCIQLKTAYSCISNEAIKEIDIAKSISYTLYETKTYTTNRYLNTKRTNMILRYATSFVALVMIIGLFFIINNVFNLTSKDSLNFTAMKSQNEIYTSSSRNESIWQDSDSSIYPSSVGESSSTSSNEETLALNYLSNTSIENVQQFISNNEEYLGITHYDYNETENTISFCAQEAIVENEFIIHNMQVAESTEYKNYDCIESSNYKGNGSQTDVSAPESNEISHIYIVITFED